MSARARHRSGVDDALAAWLADRLPTAEFAVQLAARADVVIELVDSPGGVQGGPHDGDRQPPRAVAVGVASSETLSGARLWLALTADDDVTLDPLVAQLAELAATRGGVELTGPAAVVVPAARGVGAACGVVPHQAMSQRLLAATSVRAPGGVPGRARISGVDDRLLVAGWLDEFMVEALGAAPRGAAAWVDQVAAAGAALQVWDVDGEPVALAQVRGTTGVSSRIGPVWTPPVHRRRGYAAALTAEVTRRALDGGDERVVLLTDVRNPTSNRLYERLGYRQVCAHASWSVVPGGRT